MTDDDVERRLRSALHAKANRAVGADSPPRRWPPRRRVRLCAFFRRWPRLRWLRR